LNIDVAEQEVQEGMNAAQTFLPSICRPPDLQQIKSGGRTGDDTGCYLENTSTGARRRPGRHASRAENVQLSGVGLVSISGGHKPACAHPGKPHRIMSYGINLDDLR